MRTLVLKGFPEPIHKALRQRAKEHRCTVSQEAINILERLLFPHRITLSPKPLKLKTPLSVAEIQQAIDRGRR